MEPTANRRLGNNKPRHNLQQYKQNSQNRLQQAEQLLSHEWIMNLFRKNRHCRRSGHGMNRPQLDTTTDSFAAFGGHRTTRHRAETDSALLFVDQSRRRGHDDCGHNDDDHDHKEESRPSVLERLSCSKPLCVMRSKSDPRRNSSQQEIYSKDPRDRTESNLVDSDIAIVPSEDVVEDPLLQLLGIPLFVYVDGKDDLQSQITLDDYFQGQEELRIMDDMRRDDVYNGSDGNDEEAEWINDYDERCLLEMKSSSWSSSAETAQYNNNVELSLPAVVATAQAKPHTSTTNSTLHGFQASAISAEEWGITSTPLEGEVDSDADGQEEHLQISAWPSDEQDVCAAGSASPNTTSITRQQQQHRHQPKNWVVDDQEAASGSTEVYLNHH